MKIKTLIFLLAIPGFISSIEITEAKAVEMALENNTPLKIQRVAETNALLDKETTYNVLYPKLQLTNSLTRFNSDQVATGTTLMNPMDPTSVVMYEQDISETNYSPMFEASLVLSPALINGVRLLNENAKLESLKTIKEEKSVIQDTKKSFYTLLLLQEQLKVYEGNRIALENRYEQIKKNYSAGYVDELTLLEVEVALKSLNPQIDKLKQAIDISLMNFNMILGLPLDSELIIVGSIESRSEEFDRELLIEEVLSKNSDLNITYKNIDLLDEQIKLKQNSSFLPALGVSYSMQSALNDPFNMDNWDQDNFADDMGKGMIFLSMNFAPLLPNSRERVEIQKLKNSKISAELGAEELKKGLELQITQHLNNIKNSLDLQVSLKSTLKLAEKKLHLTNVAYNQGNKELLEVETAQNELRKAELELLSEEYNYLMSLFEIEKLTGEIE